MDDKNNPIEPEVDANDLAPDAPPTADELARAEAAGRTFVRNFTAVLLMCAILAAFTAALFGAFWLHQMVDDTNQRSVTPYLGTVQRISFIGGLRTRTQVDTETRSVLLEGVVDLRKGHRLELRPQNVDGDVCDLDSAACYRRAAD